MSRDPLSLRESETLAGWAADADACSLLSSEHMAGAAMYELVRVGHDE